MRERESTFADEEIRNLLEHRKREGERVAAHFSREGHTVQIVQQAVQSSTGRSTATVSEIV